MRQLSLFDQIIIALESKKNGFYPKKNIISERLMRINHSGEVCAQALYLGQAYATQNPSLENKLKNAAMEEQIHLSWCKNRINELNGRTSLLNPIWAAGSFGIGVIAGLAGDKISLGFLAETEHQVVRHLDKHLDLLPESDTISREILTKMREDELRHATNALNEGGTQLPKFIRGIMSIVSRIMTTTAKYI
jgi:3-demethoxyubiquinol 3-hydroxylase